jgi:hypothetical protein
MLQSYIIIRVINNYLCNQLETEPQIHADERGFVAMHLRLSVFICG